MKAITELPYRLEPFGGIGYTVYDFLTPEAAAYFFLNNQNAAMPCWKRLQVIQGRLYCVR